MHHPALIEDLAVILCIAGFVTVLFQKIKQPPVLGYLLAGLIIGPYTPPFSFLDDEHEIRILAELGVIFLMFSLGLEFSYRKLASVGVSALIIGLFEVVVMILIGFVAGELLGWSTFDSLLLGTALSISSTTIIIKALEQFHLKKAFFAELMVGVLLIEDLLAILLMVFISTTIGYDSIFSTAVFLAGLKLLGVVASWFLLGYFFIPYLMRKIKKNINHETLTIISTGLCLFLSSVAVYFNYSAALGAFIMGSILAETALAKKIEMLTLPIRDVFAAVFFVSVGMLIDPFMILKYFPTILLLSAVTIIGKILTSGFGSLLAGQSIETSLKIGFGMAQIGEFSFIIIGLGGSMMVVEESLYPIIVAIATLTTFTTPYLIKFSLKFSKKIERRKSPWLTSWIKNYHIWIARLPWKGVSNFISGEELVRFFINAIIVSLIAQVSFSYLSPHFFPDNEHTVWVHLLIVLGTYVVASPFIWAMLFSAKKTLPKIFFLLLAIVQLLYLMSLEFVQKEQYFAITAILGLFFIINYDFLKSSYYWLEKCLINNLAKQKESESFPQLGFWEYDLTHLEVREDFPGVGTSLKQSHLTPAYGFHVVALKRDDILVLLPKETEKLHLSDEIILLGDREEIEQYRAFLLKVEHLQ